MSASMQQSGIEWIGLVPSHWKIVPFKFCYTSSNAGEVIDKSHWHYGNELLYTCQRTPMKSSFSEFPLIKRTTSNDLLLTRNGTPYVHLPINNSIYSNVVQRVKLNQNINREFAGYMLGSAAKQLRGFGDIIESFNMGTWNATIFLIPPINEQIRLVKYIGNKTTLIDSKISNLEKLAMLLEEKRSALIIQTVTKGLDPDLQMKDSEIDWIGKIPEHWRISKAKRHSEIFVPERNKPKQNSDKIGIPWITTSDIGAEYVSETDTELWVSEIEIDVNGSRILPQNSVIATCVGEFGLSSINMVDCIINQQLQAYITNSIHPEFLRYVLIAGKQYFESVCNFTTLSYVNKEKFGEIPIPYPSILEQKQIATWLSDRLAKISEITTEISNSIVKFSEYRTALTSAVVTGKIDISESV